MNFDVGDLVVGLRPWNDETLVGVILQTNTEQYNKNVFQVHWINTDSNRFTKKKTFITWEVEGSLRRAK